MKRVIFIITTFVMIAVSQGKAYAFWGSEARQNSSGLDVTAGYDVNTVITIRGTVLTPPARIEKGEHAQMTIAKQQSTVIVLLGPWPYWEKHGLMISRNQEISISGSLAQGKDGSEYLFAQKLENITDGTSITLRTEKGSPLWSRSGSGSVSGAGQRSGGGPGTGSGYRGGSMRGGGRR
ncbi:MAG: DNA-binding protein [Geobacteraceae bacterium]|nr:DNA-binding protein [Geobacteraceae bacterium]NTW81699.1 DNA-binding protein [Geobacteraceae bacterium]